MERTRPVKKKVATKRIDMQTLMSEGEGDDLYMQKAIIHEKRGLVPYRPKVSKKDPSKGTRGYWRETHYDGPKHVP